MRKLFDDLSRRISEFVAQRDNVALVVRSAGAEGTLILKVLDTIQETATSEMYWVFSDDFTTPAEYANTVVEQLAVKHHVVRLLQEKEKMAVWPPYPDNLRDTKMPPAKRLQELMMFARSLLPAPEGLVVVCVMLPLQIDDPKAYAALMRDVLKHEYPFPWCHHIRIILRDDTADPALSKLLGKPPRIAWHEVDFGPKAMENAIEQEIGDEELPLDQRMQAVLVSAHLDVSNKRFDVAMQKFQLLFPFYAAAGNLALTALVWNSMGEVHLAQGRKKEAGDCFESALVPASEGNPPQVPVLLNVIWNLAELRFGEKKWADAEPYYLEAQKLAAMQRNAPLKVLAIEKLGQSQYEQGKTKEAVETWNVGITVAEKLNLPDARKSMLERLKQHYSKTRDRTGAQEIEKRLANPPPPPPAEPAAASPDEAR